MMKTIFRPDYDKAERKAYYLLQLAGVKKFPIKFNKLIKQFSNLKLRKYTWFAKKWSMSVEEVCDLTKSNEGCCWYIKDIEQYMILYNDTVDNPGRIRWTIAHELGHFMLKHNEITNRSIFARNSLTEEEYEVFEKEANCFARNLLAPNVVLRELKPDSPHFISNMCNVSYEASTHIYNFLIEGARRGISYSKSHPSIKLFKDYIFKKKNTYYCSHCNHTFIFENPKFCPMCKNTGITKGEINKMIYSSIELTELHQAKECPNCSNENTTGNYCQICGIYIINKCTGYDRGETEHEYNYNNSRIFWHSDNKGCGELLNGDARFCPQCGSTSTFYEQGILKEFDADSKPQTVLFPDEIPF